MGSNPYFFSFFPQNETKSESWPVPKFHEHTATVKLELTDFKDNIIDLNDDNDDKISENQNEIESIPAPLSTPLSILSSSTKVVDKGTK